MVKYHNYGRYPLLLVPNLNDIISRISVFYQKTFVPLTSKAFYCAFSVAVR